MMATVTSECLYGSAIASRDSGQSAAAECPYRAGPCPKVEDLDDTVEDLVVQVRRMNSYLMIIMGIIAVECGICVL